MSTPNLLVDAVPHQGAQIVYVSSSFWCWPFWAQRVYEVSHEPSRRDCRCDWLHTWRDYIYDWCMLHSCTLTKWIVTFRKKQKSSLLTEWGGRGCDHVNLQPALHLWMRPHLCFYFQKNVFTSGPCSSCEWGWVCILTLSVANHWDGCVSFQPSHVASIYTTVVRRFCSC